MYSFTSPDPLGIALAYLTIALAVLGASLAISLPVLSRMTDALERRGAREAPAEPERDVAAETAGATRAAPEAQPT